MAEETQKRFVVDYASAINQFANTMHKFPVKKIFYRNLFRGRGLEFDSYRDFQPDDDASFIDWKASLRAQSLLARKYIEERDLHVYLFVDVSNSMLFGSGDKLKAEYAAEFLLALAYLVLESGDKIGLMMYNDSIVKFIPPSSGKKHFHRIISELSNPDNYGGDASLYPAIDYVLEHINYEYSVFILVSDFIRVHSQIGKKLLMLASKFETLAIMMRDPLDDTLPKTTHQLSVRDPYSSRQILIDSDLARNQYELSAQKQKERVKELFLKARIDLLELNISEPFFLPFSSFLRRRGIGERT